VSRLPVFRLATLCALLAYASACGGSDEKPEDDDFERHVAKPLPMNKVHTDSLSFRGGDMSDWKIFNVDVPGLVTVTIAFDRPDADCEAYLADKYGAKVAREVQSANPKIVLTRRVDPGRFFVWVHAPKQSCTTQYSIEARLEPD
jgi:hypothetical protein